MSQDWQAGAGVARALGGEWLFERLPPWVADTLTTEQKEAIHEALRGAEWASHPVNIRFTVPFIGRYYYVTVVGGEGRRSAERRAHDHNKYPLRTVANVFFFLGVGAAFYAAALVGLALYGVVVEF